MKEKEFAKLKVGDKVRIVSKKTGGCWNLEGEMDKWLGKIMTIRRVEPCVVRMEEDADERFFRGGWAWHPHMIECKVTDDYPTIVEHLVKGKKTIVKLSNGKVGVAKCSPEDEFDYYEGLRLAIARAYGKEEPYKKAEKVKEVERFAKVGEYIKIVNPVMTAGHYNKGDILKVCKIPANPLGSSVVSSIFDGFVRVERDGKEIDWCVSGGEYVVLENYRPKKPEVKEVKRHAEVGEYIKIVKDDYNTKDFYKPGDILKVYRNDGKYMGYDGVYCGMKKKTLSGVNHDGNIIILDREYVVLENYQPKKPEVKEVKRHAEVGEYIKIVNPSFTLGEYTENDILKVYECVPVKILQFPEKGWVRTERNNGEKVKCITGPKEYVVLEGYEPKKK